MTLVMQSQKDKLEEILTKSVARFDAAISNLIGGDVPFKVMKINPIDGDACKADQVFEIPMIPYQWIESFEGLETMMIDDTPEKTICLFRSHGQVRLPAYYHKRNKRMLIISGTLVDYVMNKSYEKDSIIDYPAEVVRDLEFIDCTVVVTLTPTLEFKK